MNNYVLSFSFIPRLFFCSARRRSTDDRTKSDTKRTKKTSEISRASASRNERSKKKVRRICRNCPLNLVGSYRNWREDGPSKISSVEKKRFPMNFMRLFKQEIFVYKYATYYVRRLLSFYPQSRNWQGCLKKAL